MIQKSYQNSEYGKLYLIPTPIGNLDDITLRAIKTLSEVDIVYAEDTRETLNLLKYLKINKKVESCHKYTEKLHSDKIISILESGKNIGYVTDRGTPLISDPGNVIVDEAIKKLKSRYGIFLSMSFDLIRFQLLRGQNHFAGTQTCKRSLNKPFYYHPDHTASPTGYELVYALI